MLKVVAGDTEKKLLDRGFDLRPMVSWVSLDRKELNADQAAEREKHTVIDAA